MAKKFVKEDVEELTEMFKQLRWRNGCVLRTRRKPRSSSWDSSSKRQPHPRKSSPASPERKTTCDASGVSLRLHSVHSGGVDATSWRNRRTTDTVLKKRSSVPLLKPSRLKFLQSTSSSSSSKSRKRTSCDSSVSSCPSSVNTVRRSSASGLETCDSEVVGASIKRCSSTDMSSWTSSPLVMSQKNSRSDGDMSERSLMPPSLYDSDDVVPPQSCPAKTVYGVDEVSMDELAAYMDVMLHIPRSMSTMAERMYT